MTSEPHLPRSAAPGVEPAAVACPDTGFGLIEVRGNDAATFLHGQVSSDVRALEPGRARYSSYNSPKGRMLANMIVVRSPAAFGDDGFFLLLAADLVEAIRRRLSMFVLRAKVTVRDASGDYAIWGLAGPGREAAARAAFGVVPGPFEAQPLEHGVLVLALPDGRLLAVCPRAQAASLQADILHHAELADAQTWRRLDIQAGIPWIGAATSDLFVPQTANWEVLGGVDFQKGCYPGQEIVARTQYLGRLKERLFAFHAAVPDVAPASKLHSSTFGDQACGTVVSAVPDPDGGCLLLAVVQVAAVESADLRLGDGPGTPLALRPLPYALPPATAPRPRSPANA
ncbi:MAG TPA: folate-binding protein [Casimicrobiaceae bacterium]|nr:folate-binding protein [Casimicrobiaceae bacterium]